MLGLARRAGKLVYGFDATVSSIKEEKAQLVVVACDISEKTEKNVRFEAVKKAIDVIKSSETIEDISRGIGKKAGVLAIIDKDFAKGVLAKSLENNIGKDE